MVLTTVNLIPIIVLYIIYQLCLKKISKNIVCAYYYYLSKQFM